MATVNPYLIFNGNCEEAFLFYKSVFGNEFSYIGKFNEMPPSDDQPKLSDEDGNKIMHVTLPISEGFVLMGSDSNEASGLVRIGSNISGNLYNVAFKTPSGQIVLIVENDGTAAETFNIKYNQKQISTTLNAGAVATYVW